MRGCLPCLGILMFRKCPGVSNIFEIFFDNPTQNSPELISCFSVSTLKISVSGGPIGFKGVAFVSCFEFVIPKCY